jgi:DNA-directed RNA polymerase subunit RPC12/RpoP
MTDRAPTTLFTCAKCGRAFQAMTAAAAKSRRCICGGTLEPQKKPPVRPEAKIA